MHYVFSLCFWAAEIWCFGSSPDRHCQLWWAFWQLSNQRRGLCASSEKVLAWAQRSPVLCWLVLFLFPSSVKLPHTHRHSRDASCTLIEDLMVVPLESEACVCVRVCVWDHSQKREKECILEVNWLLSPLLCQIYVSVQGKESSQNSVLGWILTALVNRPSNRPHTLFCCISFSSFLSLSLSLLLFIVLFFSSPLQFPPVFLFLQYPLSLYGLFPQPCMVHFPIMHSLSCFTPPSVLYSKHSLKKKNPIL